MRAPIAVSILFGLALAACDEPTGKPEPESPAQARTAEVAGLTIPGGLAEAKLGGFTTCDADYYRILCRLANPPSLLGVRPASATVSLHKSTSDATGFIQREHVDVRLVPVEHLRYQSIELHLVETGYDSDCIERAVAQGDAQAHISRPASCLQGRNSIGHLVEALERNGWVRISSKRFGDMYAHSKEAYTVTLQEDQATIALADQVAVRERLAELAQRAETTRAAETAGEALKDRMKQQ